MKDGVITCLRMRMVKIGHTGIKYTMTILIIIMAGLNEKGIMSTMKRFTEKELSL